ncbi:MAG: HAMP domain-containing histidine kinase [Mailhella sp.]|nr:HAMP domain-containing histidine kinase [Mailhella sp.]
MLHLFLRLLIMLAFIAAPLQVTAYADGAGTQAANPADDASAVLSVEYLIDPVGDLPPEQAAAGRFSLYAPGMAAQEAGTYWFKVKLTENAAGILDLGSRSSALATVFIRNNEGVWQAVSDLSDEGFSIMNGGLYDLSAMGHGGELLVRLSGVPDFWFMPVVYRPMSIALTFEKFFVPILGVFTVLLSVMCLLRGLYISGPVRDTGIWMFFLGISAVAQQLLGSPSMPAGVISAAGMPSVIASGLCIFFLTQMGRSVMGPTPNGGRHVLLTLIGIAGASLILLPLFPKYSASVRFFPLWACFAVFPLLYALLMILRSVRGSLPYAMICLIIGLGGLAAFYGSDRGQIWSCLPLAATSLAAGFLLLWQNPDAEFFPGETGSALPDSAEVPLEGSTARIDTSELELRLREPLEGILRNSSVLDQELKDEKLHHLNRGIMQNGIRLYSLADHLEDLLHGEKNQSVRRDSVFDLPEMIRKIVSDYQPIAEKKQIGIGWYIAPQLGTYYRADGERLEKVLRDLLMDAVNVAEHGVISLRVRRTDSTDPGHLLFSLTTAGENVLSHNRAVLLRAWELASMHDGIVEMNSTPKGLTLAFSLCCEAMVLKGPADTSPAGNAQPRPIIVVSTSAIQRHTLSWFLDDRDVRESVSAEKAIDLYDSLKKRGSVPSLIILDSALPPDDYATIIGAVKLNESEGTEEKTGFLGLYDTPDQDAYLQSAGCSYTVPSIAGRDRILQSVGDLLKNPDAVSENVLAARRSAAIGQTGKEGLHYDPAEASLPLMGDGAAEKAADGAASSEYGKSEPDLSSVSAEDIISVPSTDAMGKSDYAAQPEKTAGLIGNLFKRNTGPLQTMPEPAVAPQNADQDPEGEKTWSPDSAAHKETIPPVPVPAEEFILELSEGDIIRKPSSGMLSMDASSPNRTDRTDKDGPLEM